MRLQVDRLDAGCHRLFACHTPIRRDERGSERRIQVKRLGKNGQYQVIKVKPGDPIQASDIIRVKESIF